MREAFFETILELGRGLDFIHQIGMVSREYLQAAALLMSQGVYFCELIERYWFILSSRGGASITVPQSML